MIQHFGFSKVDEVQLSILPAAQNVARGDIVMPDSQFFETISHFPVVQKMSELCILRRRKGLKSLCFL